MTGAREKPSLSLQIRSREPLIGLVVKMPSPAIVETAGHTGFDLVVIDTEHGSDGTYLLEGHLRAAESAGIPALVRVGEGNELEILRALDAGAQGIVVPRVTGADHARRVVRAAHYPPLGTRGLATSTRAGKHGLLTVDEHVRLASRRTVVVVQIEDVSAMAEAAAIARVEGVDAVFVGPSDLSMSLGYPGDLSHPEVSSAVDTIASTVLESDTAALCVLVGDEAAARAWHSRKACMAVFAAPSLISAEFARISGAVRRTSPAGGHLEGGRHVVPSV